MEKQWKSKGKGWALAVFKLNVKDHLQYFTALLTCCLLECDSTKLDVTKEHAATNQSLKNKMKMKINDLLSFSEAVDHFSLCKDYFTHREGSIQTPHLRQIRNH